MSPPHEEATAALPPANSVVAGDLGLSAVLTFAGEREPITRRSSQRRLLHRVWRFSRALSRKVEGLNNRGKARRRLETLYVRMTCV